MKQEMENLRGFEIPGIARFEESAESLISLSVTSAAATGRIYLQGAHATHFQPHSQSQALFLSAKSAFSPGKAIRGGVPVIFPWFGSREGRPGSPAHGFARTRVWELKAVTVSADGEVSVCMVLRACDETRTQWPHEFLLRHRVKFGDRLEMQLETENSGAEPFRFEEALHTYLSVEDVREVTVSGLAETEYVDKTDGFRSKRETSGLLTLTQETDRLYVDTRTDCLVKDSAGRREIEISKQGSDTTVVWNPWSEKTAEMKDMAADEWLRMLCIETANAGKNAVTLAPGERHVMRAAIQILSR